MRKQKSISWEKGLIKDLKDDDFAYEYLKEVLELNKWEFNGDVLLAICRIAKARGVQVIAKKAKLQRDTLYKALSETGNPGVNTVSRILKPMNMHLAIVQA